MARPLKDDKIRIGSLIGSFEHGGAELQLIELLKRIDRSRFDPVALTTRKRGRLSNSLKDEGIKVIPLGIQWDRLSSSVIRAIRILRSLKLDILYCVLADPIVLGSILGKLAGVTHIVGGLRGRGLTWHQKQIWGIRATQLLVDSFIVNSDAVKQMCVSREWIRPRKIEVIPNGLDLSVFSFTRDKQDVIGIVGSLKAIKGQTQFIRAGRILLSRGFHYRFVLVGDGPDREMLQALVRDLEMEDHVSFAGKVNDVADYVRRFKVVVSASATEGMSNAIIEAFSSGTPVVASNVPSNNEIVTHLETGLLYAFGDENDLARQLTLLLTNDELYKSVQKNARIRAEQWFEMSKMVRRTEDHFLRQMKCF